MQRTVKFVSVLSLALLAFGCNSMRTTPALEPDSNPLLKGSALSVTSRPLPILQEIGRGTGDDIPAVPVFTPPVAKKVWRVGHRISDVVYVSGYWIYFMYDPGRFAPQPSSRASVPVTPKLEPKAKTSHEFNTSPQITRHDSPAPDDSQTANDAMQEAAMRVAEKLRQMQAQPGAGGRYDIAD